MNWYVPPDQITQARLGTSMLFVIARQQADAFRLRAGDLYIAPITDIPDCLSIWLFAEPAEKFATEYLRGKEAHWYVGEWGIAPKVLPLSLEQIRDYLPPHAPFRLGLLIMERFP